MRREGDHNFWWPWIQFTVTNVAFVATDMGYLPALVYLLMK
jgi:hypothetical protein